MLNHSVLTCAVVNVVVCNVALKVSSGSLESVYTVQFVLTQLTRFVCPPSTCMQRGRGWIHS